MSTQVHGGKVFNVVERSPKASEGYLKKLALVINRSHHSGFNEHKFCQKHGIVNKK